MKITTIEKQVKKKDRYNIYIDGKFFIGLDESVVAEYFLREGMEVDDKLIANLQDDELIAKVFNKVMNYATYKDRTEHEIIQRLNKEEDIDEFVKEAVITKMVKYNIINDDLYVDNFISAFSEKQSINKMKRTLREKGIDKDLIECKFADLFDQDEEVEKALKELKGMKNSLKRHEGIKKKQSATRRLIYRGFNYDTIETAWNIFENS